MSENKDLYHSRDFFDMVLNSFKWFFQNRKMVRLSLSYAVIMIVVILAFVVSFIFIISNMHIGDIVSTIQYLRNSNSHEVAQMLKPLMTPMFLITMICFVCLFFIVFFVLGAVTAISYIKYIKDVIDWKNNRIKELIIFWFSKIGYYFAIMRHGLKYYIGYFLIFLVSPIFIMLNSDYWVLIAIALFFIWYIWLIVAYYKLIFSLIIWIAEDKSAQESVDLSIKITYWRKWSIFFNILWIWIILWVILSLPNRLWLRKIPVLYDLWTILWNLIMPLIIAIFKYLLYLDCKRKSDATIEKSTSSADIL